MKRTLALLAIFLLNAQPALAAISVIGDILGTTCHEATSDTSLSCTTTADIEANNIALYQLTTDNTCDTGSGTTTTTADEHTGVTLDGNAMDKLIEVCSEVDNPGGAANGATISFWVYRATGTISSGATIAATLANARTAKAALAREIGVTAGNTLQIASGGSQVAAENSIDPSSLVISGLPSKEYLFWRGIASETDSNGVFIETTNYTELTLVENTGTGSAAMQARGEWRILTGTGDTSDPTLFSGDFVSFYIALEELSTLTLPAGPFRRRGQ